MYCRQGGVYCERCYVLQYILAIHLHCNTPVLQYIQKRNRHRQYIQKRLQNIPTMTCETVLQVCIAVQFFVCLVSMYCKAAFVCIAVQFFVCIVCISCKQCKGVLQCNFLYVLQVYLAECVRVYCSAIFYMSCKYILLTM